MTSGIDIARLRAWLGLNGVGWAELARRLGVAERHLRAVLGGERTMTSAFAEGLRRELGDGGWAWVNRRSDTLIPPRPPSAPTHEGGCLS